MHIPKAHSSGPGEGFLPFGLHLLKGIALVVVADQAGVDEAGEVQLLGPEH